MPPVGSAPPPLPAASRVDSTRVDTIIERLTGRIDGWSITFPVPSYLVEAQWETVCVTPCEVHLDPNSAYRVGNAAPSGVFYLPRTPGPWHVHVHAGSSLGYYSGVTLIVAGALTAITAVTILASAGSQGAGQERAFRVFGWSAAGLGAVLAAVGLPLLLSNVTRVAAQDGSSVVGARCPGAEERTEDALRWGPCSGAWVLCCRSSG